MSGSSNGVTGNSICNSSQIVVIFCVFVFANISPSPPLSLCVCVCVCLFTYIQFNVISTKENY